MTTRVYGSWLSSDGFEESSDAAAAMSVPNTTSCSARTLARMQGCWERGW